MAKAVAVFRVSTTRAVVIADNGLNGGGNADGRQQEKQPDADRDTHRGLGHRAADRLGRGEDRQAGEQNGLAEAAGKLLQERGKTKLRGFPRDGPVKTQLAQPQLHRAPFAQGEVVDHHQAGDDLGRSRGDSSSCDPPVEHIDGQRIQDDIQYAAGNGAEHHPLGTAVHPDKQAEAVGCGVEEGAAQHDPEIGQRIGHHRVLRAEGPQQRHREQISQQDQAGAQDKHQKKAVVQDVLRLFALPLSQPQGQQRGAAGAHQHGKGVHKPHGRMGHGGGCNADLSHKVAHKHLVDDII